MTTCCVRMLLCRRRHARLGFVAVLGRRKRRSKEQTSRARVPSQLKVAKFATAWSPVATSGPQFATAWTQFTPRSQMETQGRKLLHPRANCSIHANPDCILRSGGAISLFSTVGRGDFLVDVVLVSRQVRFYSFCLVSHLAAGPLA
jgi:hypothetical protein